MVNEKDDLVKVKKEWSAPEQTISISRNGSNTVEHGHTNAGSSQAKQEDFAMVRLHATISSTQKTARGRTQIAIANMGGGAKRKRADAGSGGGDRGKDNRKKRAWRAGDAQFSGHGIFMVRRGSRENGCRWAL